MKIALIPLDERPVNTRYPRMLAEIAGAELLMPPKHILSDFRTPANTTALIEWLMDVGVSCDTVIVGCETYGYGGLITSRISDESAVTILNRLETLRVLKERNPDLRLFGFNLITRISRHDDAMEEPLYWAEYGARLYHFSQLLDRVEQGQPYDEELSRLRGEIPNETIRDFIQRRQRNHIVNLYTLNLAAAGVFDLLVISSDDTSQYGLGSREKHWLNEWAARLDLDDRLLMYPGADEVGSILVARAINEAAGQAPQFQVDYAVPGGDNITAAFEDSAVRVTVERQIRAAGGIITTGGGDIYLMVNPPRSPDMEWTLPYSDDEQQRVPHLRSAVERLREQVEAGKVTAVADVANANGADVAWVDLLREAGLLLKLDAYSAWNTAGNTLGTTIAQACIAWQHGRDSKAQKRFLAHRLIEDWVYMGVIRNQVNDWVSSEIGSSILTPEQIASMVEQIETGLHRILAEAKIGFHIVPGSVTLPWKRTFEIDFELEADS